jgi:hypothetical protein
MSIVLAGGTSGISADVDPDSNLKVQIRTPGFGTLGCYELVATSGAIAATLAAGSTLFSLRWTDATRFCLIKRIRASAVVVSAITTAVVFDLAVSIARSYTASDSGGTTLTPLNANNKMRTSMGNSLMGSMSMATTAALTVGTRTVDTLPVGRFQGLTGTTIGTQIFGTGGPMALLDRSVPGLHPILLAQNEGIVVTNPLAGPATGTFTILIEIEWEEVPSY